MLLAASALQLASTDLLIECLHIQQPFCQPLHLLGFSPEESVLREFAAAIKLTEQWESKFAITPRVHKLSVHYNAGKGHWPGAQMPKPQQLHMARPPTLPSHPQHAPTCPQTLLHPLSAQPLRPQALQQQARRAL